MSGSNKKPTFNMQKGEIFRGTKTKHPIIFLDRQYRDSFYGCLITHDSTKNNNYRFLPEHFKDSDERGTRFDISYDKSFFVKLVLVKDDDWGPYNKIGELTIEGITFLENALRGIKPIYWSIYLESIKK